MILALQLVLHPHPEDGKLFHKPAMADNEGLSRQRIGFKRSKCEGDFGDVFHRREFVIDSAAQHDGLDHLIFSDAQRFGLFGDLLFDQWRFHKAGADDV